MRTGTAGQPYSRRVRAGARAGAVHQPEPPQLRVAASRIGPPPAGAFHECRRAQRRPLGRAARRDAPVTVAVGASGSPSPALFAALLVGLVYALAGGVPLAPAGWVVAGSQAMVGVAMGASFNGDSLTGLGGRWVGVAVVVLGTLGVSLLAGLLLSAATGLDRPTALLGLVAGGASGIVGMERRAARRRPARRLHAVRPRARRGARRAGGRGALPRRRPGGRRARRRTAAWRRTSPTPRGPARPGSRWARLLPIPAGTVLLPMIVAAVLSGTGSPPPPRCRRSSRTSPSRSSGCRSGCASRRRRCGSPGACCRRWSPRSPA